MLMPISKTATIDKTLFYVITIRIREGSCQVRSWSLHLRLIGPELARQYGDMVNTCLEVTGSGRRYMACCLWNRMQ